MLASNLVPRASFCFFKIDKNTKLLSTREALGTRLIKIECFYYFICEVLSRLGTKQRNKLLVMIDLILSFSNFLHVQRFC